MAGVGGGFAHYLHSYIFQTCVHTLGASSSSHFASTHHNILSTDILDERAKGDDTSLVLEGEDTAVECRDNAVHTQLHAGEGITVA